MGKININEKTLKFYNVHFPSNFHPAQMRIESFQKLKELIASHSEPSVALGDFNLTKKFHSQVFFLDFIK